MTRNASRPAAAPTPSRGIVSGVRVSHERASVDDLEAATAADQRTVVESLLAAERVEEAFALQTCNRAEAYVVTETVEAGRSALAGFAPDLPATAVTRMGHEESLRHLLRVTAGLESLVLGEDQILGQVRDAYEDARAVGAVGPVLEDAVLKAIHVGERARTETAINEGALSVSSAAVALAARERDLTGETALVVGAGEMGRLAAHAFADTGVAAIYVANRSFPRAERVVEALEFPDARPVDFDLLPACLARADVVVTATGSADPVLDSEVLADAGDLLVVDIAQPRDVAPAAADLDGATVYDLDALDAVTSETRARRREAARTVEAMVDREFDHLQDQYKRKRADEAIAAMYAGAEAVKRRELATALSRLEAAGDLSADQREVVESLADALVSRLLAAPTGSLRDAAAEDDWTTINTALQLFDPDFEGEIPSFLRDESAPDAPAQVSDDD